jgi:hypothetical protein
VPDILVVEDEYMIQQKALNFLETTGRTVELAWARTLTNDGDLKDVISALTTYQNPDGGFGKHLEIDIHAPDSQPFAARLAMQVMISIGISRTEPIVQKLATWLEREQGEDGCWRFPPGVYQHELAPWFAGWTFPSLNPALDLAGLAKRLGIGSPRLFDRVAVLANHLASIKEIETGAYYEILPYAEYYPWIVAPNQHTYLDLLASRITSMAANGEYEDAGHFFGHVGPAGGEIARRLSPELIAAQLDRLRSEQLEDGGWPSPYSPDWRPWITADAITILHTFGDR